MKKIEDKRNHRLEYEGETWNIDCATWFDKSTGKGEFRVYRIEGNICSPNLMPALEYEAGGKALMRC